MSMIVVNRIGDSLTGSYNNETFGVSFNPERYSDMLELEKRANEAKDIDELYDIFSEFKELLTEDFKTRVESSCPDIYVCPASNNFFLKVGKVISSVVMPTALVDRIKESIDKGIDHQPLVKFWIRWLRNPILRKKTPVMQADFSERIFTYINAIYVHNNVVETLMEEEGLSEEVAKERATVYQVKITNEGLLCTYKVSKELFHKYAVDENDEVKQMPRYAKKVDPDTGIVSYDEPEFVEQRLFEPAVMGQGGDAFYCESLDTIGETAGHVIRVGANHRLPDWSCVNTNNDTSCVKGLHVGGLSYIRGYQHDSTVTHNVFVDPMHVGAVPAASHEADGAIRCLQYFVHSSFAGVNGSIYHSSQYAELTDKQWLEMKQEILKTFGEHVEAFAEDIEEVEAM
jgi:hypothetical protein